MKKFALMFGAMAIFYTLAVVLWKTTGQIFYLLNFFIIGTSLAMGMGLWPLMARDKKNLARLVSQVLVGGYLFFGLGCGLIYMGFGIIQPENMQIEGFWFLLFAGYFAAAVMHYTIAKIIGPLIFGRGWCGWACWTTAVLDLLPWKKTPGRVEKKWEYLRYAHFAVSLLLVVILVFVLKHSVLESMGFVKVKPVDFKFSKEYANLFLIPEIWWFLLGNLFYFASGIILAAVLKDNRAFCKYLCPIAVFLKPGTKLSMLKVKEIAPGCNDCLLCEKNCPMDIRVMEYTKAGTRVGSSECVTCQTCISSCPKKVLGLTMGFDYIKAEHIRRKQP